MRNKENIQEILSYLQTTEEEELDFDEEAIVAAYQRSNGNHSLAIKILSIFGGLLACLAFLGFLFLAGLYNSQTGLSLVGTICIVVSILISKDQDKVTLDTVSVSSFITGFILIAVGFFQLEANESFLYIIFIIIALCSLRIVQAYILSFISVLIINGSILMLLISNRDYKLAYIYIAVLALANVYFFLKEAMIIASGKRLSRLYEPLRIGLIVSLLSVLCFICIGMIPLLPNYRWFSSIVIVSAILYLISILINRLGISGKQYKAGIYILSVLLLLPVALSPAISGALLIMLLSFLVNYKTGLVLAIIAFIYFIAQYYYDLSLTLLTKSILLFSSGVLFIVLYLFTHKKLTTNEKI